MQNHVLYHRKKNIVYVYHRDTLQAYPMHTHAEHITFCHVVEGAVRIVFDGRECLYHAGGYFCIMPDIRHAVEPLGDTAYSMISVCIPAFQEPDKPEHETSDSKRLKQIILKEPESAFLIEDMEKQIGISPYHMIRKFKAACGLTPHQFQIQCRVRKAQILLEEGKSVTEAAYATGFCDQSHFDRCFRKIVQLTPSAYKQALT
ncbi:MAG: AraC family transcriptional regulator [Clostridium sp.]|nr:AraC family transcriptional regulator [Clostridium sp.]